MDGRLANDIRSRMSEVRMLVLINPNNPTGAILSASIKFFEF